MKTYLVGGAVRDKLLGLPVTDQDWVVVGATTEEMESLGYQAVGKDFPVFLHPETKEEYALARTERKSGVGYKGFHVHAAPEVSLEDDLLRRDLTINAMAMDEQGNITDPFHGKDDLDNKILRHVSAAFSEDPLRVLRVARLAARFDHLGFNIAPDTLELMTHICSSGEIQHLVAERIWQETWRALSEPNPEVYFETLRSCGALAVLFPEIDALFGIPQVMTWHPEIDSAIHSLEVLKQACIKSPKAEIRFAALCHDLGKANTDQTILPKHHGHEQRGYRLVKQLCKRLKVPNNPRKLAELVAEFHTQCHQLEQLKPSTILRLLSSLSAFRSSQMLEDFTICCEADFNGRPGWQHLEYPQRSGLIRIAQAANQIDTQQITNQGHSGAKIGELITKARIDAIKKEKELWLQS